MSDVPETPDGAVEAAAQSAGQAQQDQSTPVMPDGWTGEFDPARAKATIDRLREFEGQLKKLESDPQAFAEFAAQHGYEFVDDAEDDETPQWEQQYDETPTEDPRISQMEQQLTELQHNREMEQLAAHVVELTSDANLGEEDQRFLFELASQPGYTPQRTEKIVKQHLAAIKAAEERAIENYRSSKRSPSPPLPGTPGEPAPDLRDEKQRREYLAKLVAAADENG
jgi:hypothetical protein